MTLRGGILEGPFSMFVQDADCNFLHGLHGEKFRGRQAAGEGNHLGVGGKTENGREVGLLEADHPPGEFRVHCVASCRWVTRDYTPPSLDGKAFSFKKHSRIFAPGCVRCLRKENSPPVASGDELPGGRRLLESVNAENVKQCQGCPSEG